ncbi:uncharacterized protein N7443_005766 [Penicillium atrosanguineum]|uniref:uncharacterized protein n=1 Tax=Penicillium atrosanguineum TaxID=1132637 RepID=UPI00238C17D0|nr:uncharacterized protein N7443_005766 [Penicillium atrosanguineum]KAJ5300764.1 hypothetical protein N7443_005766 [Penicillium atrosanguineum]
MGRVHVRVQDPNPIPIHPWVLVLYTIPVEGRVSTYDHRVWRTGLPVRSAVLKPHAGRLVVGWVTTSESLLLCLGLIMM